VPRQTATTGVGVGVGRRPWQAGIGAGAVRRWLFTVAEVDVDGAVGSAGAAADGDDRPELERPGRPEAQPKLEAAAEAGGGGVCGGKERRPATSIGGVRSGVAALSR
jgi:hypothetical protein